jgi:hypothetical protein
MTFFPLRDISCNFIMASEWIANKVRHEWFMHYSLHVIEKLQDEPVFDQDCLVFWFGWMSEFIGMTIIDILLAPFLCILNNFPDSLRINSTSSASWWVQRNPDPAGLSLRSPG